MSNIEEYFSFLWPGIVKIRRRERENQQDATNSMLTIKIISQHVSGIIMPITRRIILCTTACGVLPGCVGCGWSRAVYFTQCTQLTTQLHTTTANHSQPQPTHPGRTPHAVGHCLILLMMVIMMPEICWDISLIIDIELVASCWFPLSLSLSLSLHIIEECFVKLWINNVFHSLSDFSISCYVDFEEKCVSSIKNYTLMGEMSSWWSQNTKTDSELCHLRCAIPVVCLNYMVKWIYSKTQL